jgi:PAS domain S-box-containing protein
MANASSTSSTASDSPAGGTAASTFDLRALFDCMPQLGWTAEPDGSRDFYNRGWYEYTGTTRDEMLGWGWKKVHDPEILPAVLSRWDESIRTGLPFEMMLPLRRHDGMFRWFMTRVNAIRDGSGAIIRWVGINTDIDAQTRAGKSSQDDLDQFFEMSLDMLCIAGFDGFFKRLNPAWLTILGWSEQELLSEPWLRYVHPEDRDATVHAGSALASGANVVSFTNRYQCKDGSYRWIEWRCAPFAERGLIYGAARDITARREAEVGQAQLQKHLVAAERLVSVGTLAAGVAHEINNPLGYVMSNLDMLIEEIRALAGGSSSGRMKELEEMALDAREGSERVRKIVRGLKTFSRPEAERRAVMDVRPALELAVNMAFNEIRHRARLVKDYGDAPLVEVDDARLGQVFINLLVNAAQAIPEGHVDENEIRIMTSTDRAGRAVIDIRDTGPGMGEAVRERIFEPFFTTKAIGVGTGLGLSICHNIVASMGGEISVQSAPGRGSTFRVVLPAASVQRLADHATAPSNRAIQRKATLLVVDDEAAVGMALRRVLRDHDVTVVTKVKDALDLFRAGKRFDVIFSDLMMPEMTGMDFHAELARLSPEDAGRMVFVTGGAFTSAATEFLDRVANERLEKPFNAKEVRDLVQRLLN